MRPNVIAPNFPGMGQGNWNGKPEVTGLLFTGLTTTFLKEFVFDLWVTSPLWLTLAAVVAVPGQVVGKKKAGHDSTASTGRSLPQRLSATETSGPRKQRR